MAIIQFHQPTHTVSWGIWEITESLDELLAAYQFYDDYPDFATIHSPLRQKQWLACRLLVRALVEKQNLPFSGIHKDPHKKVFLTHSPHHISVAHSDQYATAILDLQKSTGIDIEKVSPRIQVIAKKFLSEAEKQKTLPCSNEELTVYWCAKEAMYKLYGRKLLLFSQDIHVYKQLNDHDFNGLIEKDQYHQEVKLKALDFGLYKIVYCL
jgi:phosphopantetheine--protein transferase-like protein